MGHFRSTTLLISFAPLGAFVIAAGTALRGAVPGCTRRLGLVVGACGVVAAAVISGDSSVALPLSACSDA